MEVSFTDGDIVFLTTPGGTDSLVRDLDGYIIEI